MSTFTYIARNQTGQIDRGTIEAPSMEQARETLRKRGLLTEQIQSLSNAMPWTTTEDDGSVQKNDVAIPNQTRSYLPLEGTLRLFAGWLLAWYGLVYLLGAFQYNQKLPPDVPFLQALFVSPLVLRCTLGVFLFLLFTDLHRWLGRGIGKGILLTIVAVGLFVGFHLNA